MRTKLTLDEKNRMLRIGLGKHDGKWFFRIDLWWIAYRWTKSNDPTPPKKRYTPPYDWTSGPFGEYRKDK